MLLPLEFYTRIWKIFTFNVLSKDFYKRSLWWWPREWPQHVWDKLEKCIVMKCKVFVLVWWLLWNSWHVLFCQTNRSNYKSPLTAASTAPQYSRYNCKCSFHPVRITVVICFSCYFVESGETNFLDWNYNDLFCVLSL